MLVEADQARVWELVTDIELPARHSTELRRVRWLSEGAVFEGHNRHPLLGDWRTHCHVVERDAPRAFSWVVLDPDDRFGGGSPNPARPGATWRYDLAPEGGAVRVRHSVRIGPGRTGLNLAIEMAPEHEEQVIESRLAALREAMTETLTRIKALAESR